MKLTIYFFKPHLLLAGIALLLCTLPACTGVPKEKNPREAVPEQRYLEARIKMKEMEFDSALLLLQQALSEGWEPPMQITRDSHFYALVDNPAYRPQLRALLRTFAAQQQAEVARAEEPGQAISVGGQILDESTQQPIANASVEWVQADRNGSYFEEQSMWNPRLFAYLRTNKAGAFSVQTIRPGSYEDDDGNLVPAHIHFTLEAAGYRKYASEFTFEDDSILLANGNTDGVPVASLLPPPEKKQYQVTLYMQKNE